MRYKNMILSMIILNIINTIYNVAGQESCPIVGGSHLPCILINNCPSLMTILKAARPIPESNLNILRSHHCGFDEETLKIPKVCCPSTIRFEASSEIPYETEMLNGTTPNSLKSKDHPNLKLLNHDICGPITEAKIYGGNITSVIEFPWMALLAYDVQDRVEFRCSGTIINKRYILTAAHCVTNLALGIRLKGVRVGEHDIHTERDCDRDSAGFEIICVERHQDFNIESYQFHFDYKKGALHNDIGLIRVDSDIDFRPINVKPICLPIGIAAVLNHQKLTVTGWGATETHRVNSLKLRMVILTQVSDEECAEIYKRTKPIWYKQICAGGQSGKDSCLGDSGGPLQAPALYNNNPRFVQYGIVSYGAKNCGTRGYPGVYTRVSYYVDWILDHMTD